MGTSGVSELTILLMLGVFRRITGLDESVRKGSWKKDPGRELNDKVLGVIGLGPIGREVCRLGKAFGMKVIAYDPLHPRLRKTLRGRGISGIKIIGLDKLLERSDVVSLHAHLNPKTRYMINRKSLKKMKKGAVVINTARGGLIDQKALYEELKSGHLGGAGLDVYEKEPLGKDPLAKLPNVVLTPHVGSYTEDSIMRISEMVVRLVRKYS